MIFMKITLIIFIIQLKIRKLYMLKMYLKMKELKEKGLRLYYLSNYGEFGVQETLEALDFRELMDGGIFSYEVKMIKPSRWIFEELLYRYKLNREEAVFFDDSAANAEAACQVGLHGIQFTGYEDARQKLESLLAR